MYMIINLKVDIWLTPSRKKRNSFISLNIHKHHVFSFYFAIEKYSIASLNKFIEQIREEQ